MSEALTLARPYARAAFSVAKDGGRTQAWSNMLGFAAQASGVAGVQAVLGHPTASADTMVDLLMPPGDSDPNFRQFLVVLAENRRIDLLPEVAALFDQQRAESERVVKATVTSAQPMDEASLAKLGESLRKRFGQQVEITTAVDAALIGGAVIDTGDVVIDGSLRTKLARLGAALAN
ncbi:F0F1 ATP synthase subunit delta [Arenimonas sp. MALMAid1274]|uniref:F0F1 ATP synthase subunit delta n=1 Tax=Arenimonas sp. MALMAid1274 TaxID=3411630 RepID=UPI003BA22C7D